MHLILASASPRRRELMKMIADDFDIAAGKDVNETYPESLEPEKVPEFLSRLKAAAYRDVAKSPDDVLVTADTVVIIDGRILGKPASRQEAIDMLSCLSGRTHHVVTGVTLTTQTQTITFSQTTAVHFDKIATADIITYVDRYRPYDKAGAYGIQEWIGAAAISGIEGSFYNVMGLPVHALFKHLRQLFPTEI